MVIITFMAHSGVRSIDMSRLYKVMVPYSFVFVKKKSSLILCLSVIKHDGPIMQVCTIHKVSLYSLQQVRLDLVKLKRSFS